MDTILLKKINADAWAGLVVFIFAFIFLVQSLQFPYWSHSGPGAGFFALWLSGILLILALFYMYHSLRGTLVSQESMPRGAGLKNILYILGALVVFILLVTFLGFTVTSSIFLFLLLYRAYKWHTNLAISVGVSLALFWFFHDLLRVALPVNVFGW